jgi:LmbE family N-acetylglucosaminyl deacetylase
VKSLQLATAHERLSVLCLGAHSDDIEIGVGATLLSLMLQGVRLEVQWCVLSARGQREAEARASAEEFLIHVEMAHIDLMSFEDGFFPEQGEMIKRWFEQLKLCNNPDIIFTHFRNDAHQDHREVSRLTWNTFRDNFILEYEIPKWDGDLGQPNVFMPIAPGTLDRKIELLVKHFSSQRDKHWFDQETFRALARLRGMESRASGGYAEAFFARKLVLS